MSCKDSRAATPAEDKENEEDPPGVSTTPMPEKQAKQYCWMQTGASKTKIDDFHIKQKVDNRDYKLKDYVTCFLTKIRVIGSKGRLILKNTKNWLDGKILNAKEVVATCANYSIDGSGLFNDVFRFVSCTLNKGNVKKG